MTDEDKYSIGGLACIVNDICDDHEEQLTKAALVQIAHATANLLLATSAADEQLLDAGDDELAKENADVILELWGLLKAGPAA